MKKLGLLLFWVIAFFACSAQIAFPTQTTTISDSRTEAKVANTLTIIGAFNAPRRDTNFTAQTFGQIVIRPADSLAYMSTGLTSGRKWKLLGAGGTGSGAQWGVNIVGDISAQADLQGLVATKQNVLPVGATSQYWDATGHLQTFPNIPTQISLTSPNGSISIGGTYPNITLQDNITRLGQLTNDVGFIIHNEPMTFGGDVSGSGTTNISLVLPNIIGAGSCTNCSVTFNAKGQPTAFTSGTGSNLITSVFTRTGAVVATTGDYTAAQVTNAVDATGSYTNPSWIVSIPYTKITSPPSIVNTFNTRNGAVTLTSGDVTTALGFNPVTDARTLTINGTTFDLTANRTWTITGTGYTAADTGYTHIVASVFTLTKVKDSLLASAAATYLSKANNLNDLGSVSTARSNLGLGTAAQQSNAFFAQTANNLSDIANAGTARTNLGLGNVSTRAVGTTAGTAAAGDDSRFLGTNNVTFANIVQLAANTFFANATGSLANGTAVSVTAATAMLNVATTSLKGLVPAPVTASGRVLQDDLTWHVPSAGGGTGLTHISPLDTLAKTSNPLQLSGANLFITSADDTHTGVITAQWMARLDSLYMGLIFDTLHVSHQPNTTWNVYPSSDAKNLVDKGWSITSVGDGYVRTNPTDSSLYFVLKSIGASSSCTFCNITRDTAGRVITMSSGDTAKTNANGLESIYQFNRQNHTLFYRNLSAGIDSLAYAIIDTIFFKKFAYGWGTQRIVNKDVITFMVDSFAIKALTGLGGGVTSSGNANPLFTTNIASNNINFILNNITGYGVFGHFGVGTGQPGYSPIPFQAMANASPNTLLGYDNSGVATPVSGGTIIGISANTLNLVGNIPSANGGVPTGGTTNQILSKASNSDYATQWVTNNTLADPMTTAGDIIYRNGLNITNRLGGNTGSQKTFLMSQGTGTSAQPVQWTTIGKADVSLSAVENTALSTWPGTTNIINLGTITSGLNVSSNVVYSNNANITYSQNFISDASFSLGTTTNGQIILLGTTSADRTITIPTASTVTGLTFEIHNANTSSSTKWVFSSTIFTYQGVNYTIVPLGVTRIYSNGNAWIQVSGMQPPIVVNRTDGNANGISLAGIAAAGYPRTYKVGGYINVKTTGSGRIHFIVSYTDETGAAQSITLTALGQAGDVGASTGMFTLPEVIIRVGTGSAVSTQTTQSVVGAITYDAGSSITSLD